MDVTICKVLEVIDNIHNINKLIIHLTQTIPERYARATVVSTAKIIYTEAYYIFKYGTLTMSSTGCALTQY